MSNRHTSDDSELETLPSFQSALQTCIWCKDRKILMVNAKYCKECYQNCYKVCIRCKLPYPEAKYFKESGGSDRCNSCYKKYVKEREKRLQKLVQTGQSARRGVAQQQPGTSTAQCVGKVDSPSSTSSSSDDDDDRKGSRELQVLQSLLLQALKNEMKKKKNKKKKKPKKKKSL